MARIEWDKTGEKLYETGVRNGVLYVMGDDGNYEAGVAWNGLTAVTESPSGAEETPLYAGDTKYGSLFSTEEYGGTIEAYMYPDAFAACNGEAEVVTGMYVGQQKRKAFGFCYRTAIGNDTLGEDYGYKLHIVYGARVTPSEKNHQTINDSPEAGTLSWEFTTTPVPVTGMKPTAIVTIDSTKFTETTKTKLTALEDALYGSANGDGPKLPTPDEIKTILSA